MTHKVSSIHTPNIPIPPDVRHYAGKVRDTYKKKDILFVLTSDRLSAFNQIFKQGIPFKGQVLNELAYFFMQKAKDIVPVWVSDCLNSHASVGLSCRPIAIECIVRGYLAGHALRLYQAGQRNICGQQLPDGLTPYAPLPEPIFTPTSKDHTDVDLRPNEIIKQNLISAKDLDVVKNISLALFAQGQKHAATRNLILADAKYEFGTYKGQLTLIDELHTPDAARYLEYENLNTKTPKQLSKEAIRQWLITQKLNQNVGQIDLSEQQKQNISNLYQNIYLKLYGKKLRRCNYTHLISNCKRLLKDYLLDNDAPKMDDQKP